MEQPVRGDIGQAGLHQAHEDDDGDNRHKGNCLANREHVDPAPRYQLRNFAGEKTCDARECGCERPETGSRTSKDEPPPERFPAEILPPYPPTITRAVESPSPVCSRRELSLERYVKNRSKTRSR